MTNKKVLTVAIAAALTGALALTSNVVADKKSFNFKAIDESANADNWDAAVPWKLPKGFEQAKKRFPHINWNEVLKSGILKKLEELKKFEELKQRGEL